MTTIQEIARRTGVSIATVSRVLNGYPDVRPATRARIQQVIDELGYSAGALGRGRDAGQSMVIGVYYMAGDNGDLNHPYFQDILNALKQTFAKAGYDTLFLSLSTTESETAPFDARARMRKLDGVVLVSIPRTDARTSAISVSQIPCISIDLDLIGARAGYVCSDNLSGATQAMEYLIASGHTQIAFIGDKFDTKPGHDRLVGYQQTLTKHGIGFRPEWVRNGDFSDSSGYELAMALLRDDETPTALFCAGDLMAIGAMRAIRDSGFAPGEDVSVVGFDDLAIASYVTPALTTVRQHRHEIGACAAESLLRLIAEPQTAPPIISVRTELVVRDSVKVLH